MGESKTLSDKIAAKNWGYIADIPD